MQEMALEMESAGHDLEQRFSAFVGSHFERARRLAWRLIGGDEAAAEDVVQDAFVRAYQALPRFRGDSSVETWFYRILVRQAHNHRRWRAVRELWTRTDAQDVPDARASAPGDPALRRRISAALNRLSPGQREAFVLVHMEGFTVREAAELMGKAEGTTKSHLSRALQAIRKELRDLKPSGGEGA